MSPADAAAATRENPVLIVGAGGHAKVVLEAIRRAGMTVHGLCDASPEQARRRFPGETILGGDDEALALPPGDVTLTIGVGAARVRAELFRTYRARGFGFATVIHPSAVIAGDVEIGEGAQIMAGAVVQPGTTIGINTVINSRASVDHDCHLGDHAFVAPGAVLCGGVEVGGGAMIGAGATVIENIRIGDGATVAAGAVVTADVAPETTVMGVPARVTNG